MHLKSLEIIGFKSFADRTRLDFEPGMVAIVGPNGCGKSNISDAIRWVLGEQRPTALRCSKLVDVVFNGTDARKPLNMAEVSITFANCEGVLDTEFNEITITRRVFRSGESHYFINKTACRLRDIHRLLMGTGIGTTSYSIMAQGQIDAILTSKPEERRAVFEEAAGISKFKADRKESLRKLEQTDVNLLRLADVIREVKRQVGSMQRQAGRAQRYKELRDELRGLDLFVTRRRLAALDIRIKDLNSHATALSEKLANSQQAVIDAEQKSADIHTAIIETEHTLGTLIEAATQSDNRLTRAQEVIRVNEQRIIEYNEWSQRDNREINSISSQVKTLSEQLSELTVRHETSEERYKAARQAMDDAQHEFDLHKESINQARADLQRMREESLIRERRATQIQNRLTEIESQQRSTLLHRDRLAAEAEQLQENLAAIVENRNQVEELLAVRRDACEQLAEQLTESDSKRQAIVQELRIQRETLSQLQSQAAAKQAQLDLLNDRKEASDEFQPGTTKLLDAENPLLFPTEGLVGPLADQLTAPPDLRLAIEAALRAWIDAVVVKNESFAYKALTILSTQEKRGAARLVVASTEQNEIKELSPPEGTEPLLKFIKVKPEFEKAAKRLLSNVFLADELSDVKLPLNAGCSVVTRQGAIFHSNGCVELWMPASLVSSPLARRMLISETSAQLEDLGTRVNELRTGNEQLRQQSQTLEGTIYEIRVRLDESRRLFAQTEGEFQSINREVNRAQQRLESVSCELLQIQQKTESGENERNSLNAELQETIEGREQHVERSAATAAKLHELENREASVSAQLTECRIVCSQFEQQKSHEARQIADFKNRISELEQLLQGRTQGVQSYDESVKRLTAEIESLSSQLDQMRNDSVTLHARIEEVRQKRASQAHEATTAEKNLAQCRQNLENARDNKSRSEIELSESKMHRQNQFDRVFNDYALTPEQLVAEPDPDWKGEQPSIEFIEQRVSALTGDIQSMGPVNLVAIDEYKELEERYAFLKEQEQDLLKSKEHLVDLIRMINKKTSEMFRATFDQANANFEKMFIKLFGGGMAKLVLLENAEDPLECGVEIIARPPGKRPQTVSLLSGGERTMTAVSLLFAIYQIKPSPFCMLDELDAALDDSNIGRFVMALKDFLSQSQFLIITHNQHTIANTDIVYGVTMPERGISKVVSLKLKDIGVKELESGTPEDESLKSDSLASRGKSEKSTVHQNSEN